MDYEIKDIDITVNVSRDTSNTKESVWPQYSQIRNKGLKYEALRSILDEHRGVWLRAVYYAQLKLQLPEKMIFFS